MKLTNTFGKSKFVVIHRKNDHNEKMKNQIFYKMVRAYSDGDNQPREVYYSSIFDHLFNIANKSNNNNGKTDASLPDSNQSLLWSYCDISTSVIKKLIKN